MEITVDEGVLRDGPAALVVDHERRGPCVNRRVIPSRPTPLLVLMLALLCTGCAPTVQGASQAAAKGATGGSVQTLEDPAIRQRVAEIAGSPETQRAIEAIAGDAAKGAAQALTDEEMLERTRRLAGAIAAEATKAAMRTMADEMPRTVGPEIESVGRETAAAVRSGLVDPALREGLSSTVFELSRQAVFGSNEATAELERNKKEQGTVAHVSHFFTVGSILLWALLALLIAGVVVLSLALARIRADLRRLVLDRGVAREAASEAASEAVERERRGPLHSPT